MLDHISLGVSDLQRSAAFYDAVLAPLGYVRLWHDTDAAGYGRTGQTDDAFAIKREAGDPIAPPRRLHVAFSAGSRKGVRDFHAIALSNGAADDGAPGVHTEYGAGYFASFVIDPDGYRIEAVYHERPTAVQTTLVEATDEDFAWMLAGGEHPARDFRLPPGGVDEPVVIGHVRRITNRLRESGRSESWLIVCDDEVVGLCGHKHPPANGMVEIGYNVAPSRRRLGHATRAVALLLDSARRDPHVRTVTAETTMANVPSHRVLEANGFERAGTRHDDEDGELLLWRYNAVTELR